MPEGSASISRLAFPILPFVSGFWFANLRVRKWKCGHKMSACPRFRLSAMREELRGCPGFPGVPLLLTRKTW